MKVLVLFDSMGGNTEKVANKINETVLNSGLNCDLVKVSADTKLEFYDYDLVFVGSPVIEWLPTKTMMNFVKAKMLEHRLRGDIVPSSPFLPNKYAVCFGTFCGAHIGVDEAIPMTDWLAAFLGHIGFQVLDKIHFACEMRNFGQGKEWMNEQKLKNLNTSGRLGNILNKPNEQDLKEVELKTKTILNELSLTLKL